MEDVVERFIQKAGFKKNETYFKEMYLQDIEEIGFYFTSYWNFCDIIESRRSFHVHYFFFDLDICSYRVGKLLSIAIVLQLESCCFMEIHQI